MSKNVLRVLGTLVLICATHDTLAGQAGSAGSLESLLATPVSSASLYAQTAAQAPGAVTIVTGEDIRRFGWTTLEDVLSWTRGFHTTNDRNYSYIGVRGFSLPTDYNNRLLLLIDGHRVNDDYYGSVPASNDLGVDLNRVERIEIVRGAGSALYGSNAMFAVINIVTRQDEGGWVSASAGSWNTQGAAAGVVSSVGPVAFELSGMYGRTDGEDVYFSEFGTVEDMDGEERGSAALRASWTAFELSARFSGRTKEIPTAAWGATPHDPRTSTYDEIAWLSLRYAPDLGPATALDVTASIDHYDYDGAYPTETTVDYDMNDVNSASLAAHVRRDLRANNRLVVGGDIRRVYEATYRAWDDESVYTDDNYKYSTASIFAQDEHDITAELSILAGLRFDASDMGYAHLSPRAALVWTPEPATTMKLVYGDAFRAPTVYERYYESPDFRSADVDPEQSHMAEAILERRLGSAVQASVSAYAAHIHGLIETVEDSAGISGFRNGTNAHTKGIEAEIQARSNGYFARLAYGYTHAQMDDRPATNSPSHIVMLGLGAPLGAHVDAGMQTRWESSRLTVQDTRTPSFFLADLSVGLPGLMPGLAARLYVRNLFDADITAPGGYEHVPAAIPQPGRRLEGTLEYAF